MTRWLRRIFRKTPRGKGFTWRDTKALILSRIYDGAQVLLFRRDAGEVFRFAFAFHTDVDGMARSPTLQFHEPEPGVVFASLTYNNRHGTGTTGSGWSLYRLGEDSASLLLETDEHGYEDGWGGTRFAGFGCDIEPIGASWPKLTMACFADLVYRPRTREVSGDLPGVTVWSLWAPVEFTWDAGKQDFEPRVSDTLTLSDIRALLDDRIAFMERCIEDGSHQSGPDPILRRTVVDQYDSGGWTK